MEEVVKVEKKRPSRAKTKLLEGPTLPTKMCASDKHVFVPFKTKKYPSKYVVADFVCQHCLMNVSFRQIETLNAEYGTTSSQI